MTETWAAFSVQTLASYVVNLNSGEIFRDCDAEATDVGVRTVGRTGVTSLLDSLDQAQGTVAFRVVAGVIEEIHQEGIARCQLSADLALPGTRMPSVLYDFGGTSP